MTVTQLPPTGALYEGWTFDCRTTWWSAHHRCGWQCYLPAGADLVSLVDGHRCPNGADIDPVLGHSSTVAIDLGPVSELAIGSMALLVEELPFGLFDRHPRLRAQAERLAEALDSHLSSPEPPPAREAASPTAAARAGLHARRIAGTLRPDDPIYVSFAEVCEQAGTLPTYNGIAAAGVAWVGPDNDLPSFELCAHHLAAGVATGTLYQVLDPGALGLVIHELTPDDHRDPPPIEASHIACVTCEAEAARHEIANLAPGEPPLDATLDELQAAYDTTARDHREAEELRRFQAEEASAS